MEIMENKEIVEKILELCEAESIKLSPSNLTDEVADLFNKILQKPDDIKNSLTLDFPENLAQIKPEFLLRVLKEMQPYVPVVRRSEKNQETTPIKIESISKADKLVYYTAQIVKIIEEIRTIKEKFSMEQNESNQGSKSTRYDNVNYKQVPQHEKQNLLYAQKNTSLRPNSLECSSAVSYLCNKEIQLKPSIIDTQEYVNNNFRVPNENSFTQRISSSLTIIYCKLEFRFGNNNKIQKIMILENTKQASEKNSTLCSGIDNKKLPPGTKTRRTDIYKWTKVSFNSLENHIPHVSSDEFAGLINKILQRCAITWPSGHPFLPPKVRVLMQSVDGNDFLRRLQSFLLAENMWPDSAIVRPEPLVCAGFTYQGNGTEVICECCGIISDTNDWKRDDEDYAMFVHSNSSRGCSFVTQYYNGRRTEIEFPASTEIGPDYYINSETDSYFSEVNIYRIVHEGHFIENSIFDLEMSNPEEQCEIKEQDTYSNYNNCIVNTVIRKAQKYLSIMSKISLW